MSDAVVAPTSPPILHRDETAQHLKFIGDNTFEQLQLMKKGADKALGTIGKSKRRTPDFSVFEDLGISAEEMKESTKELKKSTIKASLAQDETIKETKKIHEAFIKSLGTYEMDIKNYAKTGGPKSLLKKYIEKRESEIFNNYAKLKESVGDSMESITNGFSEMTDKQREASQKAIDAITMDMKRITAEDKLFKKKEKDDKRKEKKEKRDQTLENIFDKTLNAVLGPLHLIVDPLQEFTGKDFGESIKKKFGLFGREKKSKEGEKTPAELMLEERKVHPRRDAILKKITGGVAFVWLRDELAKLMGKKPGEEGKEEEGKGGLLQNILGGGAGGIAKSLLGSIGAILPILGFGAIAAAIVAGTATALIKKWDILAPEISKNFVDQMKDNKVSGLEKAWDIGKYLFQVIFGVLAGGVRQIWQNAFGWIGDVWGGDSKDSLIVKIFKSIGNVIKFAFLGWEGSFAEGELKTLGKFILGLIPDGFRDFIEGIFKKIQDGLANLFKPFTDFFDAIGKIGVINIAKGIATDTLGEMLQKQVEKNSPGVQPIQKDTTNSATALNNPPKVSEAYTKAGAGLAATGGNTTMIIQEVKENFRNPHYQLYQGTNYGSGGSGHFG